MDIFENKTPHGLLDAETQQALKDWHESGNEIECFTGLGDWMMYSHTSSLLQDSIGW
jgi:hypothetical protein